MALDNDDGYLCCALCLLLALWTFATISSATIARCVCVSVWVCVIFNVKQHFQWEAIAIHLYLYTSRFRRINYHNKLPQMNRSSKLSSFTFKLVSVFTLLCTMFSCFHSYFYLWHRISNGISLDGMEFLSHLMKERRSISHISVHINNETPINQLSISCGLILTFSAHTHAHNTQTHN